MKDPATSFAVNTAGTANIFAAARDGGARRVVYASSSSVYGDHPELPKREGKEGACLSPYATSKAMCEELADIFFRCYDLEIVGLRYFNVYGPRQRPDGPYAAVIPRFFDAYRQGQAPTIHGDGEQSRDFTFVADAVRANLLAAGAPAKSCGHAYNVAAGQRTTLNQLAELIRKLMGYGPPPAHTVERPGDVRHSLADLSKVRRALGYAPQYDLPRGLEVTAQGFR
jgi:nucleoside-diphosphate-sugar epimerase